MTDRRLRRTDARQRQYREVIVKKRPLAAGWASAAAGSHGHAQRAGVICVIAAPHARDQRSSRKIEQPTHSRCELEGRAVWQALPRASL